MILTANDNIISKNLDMLEQDIPTTVEQLKALKGKVTKECLKYMIGKMCLAEKSKLNDDERVGDIYKRYGLEFGYVSHSIKRLVHYANAVDHIRQYLPIFASDILNGRMQISVNDTILLAKMELLEICNILERIANEKKSASVVIVEEKAVKEKSERRGKPKKDLSEPPRVSVKNTPPYDPDAQVNALVYTIPSWVNMVDKVFTASNFDVLSPTARNRLVEELTKLRIIAETVATLVTMED